MTACANLTCTHLTEVNGTLQPTLLGFHISRYVCHVAVRGFRLSLNSVYTVNGDVVVDEDVEPAGEGGAGKRAGRCDLLVRSRLDNALLSRI